MACTHPKSRISGKCWTCENRARQATCSHPKPYESYWAGVLGMKYYCCSCGAWMHSEDEDD